MSLKSRRSSQMSATPAALPPSQDIADGKMDWNKEISSLMAFCSAETLNRALKEWPVPCIMRFAKDWEPRKIEAVLRGWDASKLALIFQHSYMPMDAIVSCCQEWGPEESSELLGECDENVVAFVIGALYEDEDVRVWSDSTVAGVMESMKPGLIGGVLRGWGECARVHVSVCDVLVPAHHACVELV